MKHFLNLLLEFQSLPRIERSRTFMEISGFPHYENVCSNILAFFFDPSEEHGFGDLFLRAFFKMVAAKPPPGWKEPEIPGSVTISREYPAPNRQRIDLVIEADSFVIGIENKIFHWEANDLENYADAIAKLSDGRPAVKAILGLWTNADQETPKGGFIRYTYPDLWNHVRDLLGHSITNASNKWLIHLTEFMDTTDHLAGENQDEQEIAEFFSTHFNLIEDLISKRDQLIKRIAERIKAIHIVFEANPDQEKHLKLRGIWKNHTLASHFLILDQTIGLDLTGSLEGWKIVLFHLNGNDPGVLRSLIETDPIRSRFPRLEFKKEMTIQKWPPSIDDKELQDAYRTALKSLTTAADLITQAPA